MPDERDPHDLPTMPVPREPGVPDPRLTLPGSGGLDPNPDYPQPTAPAPRQSQSSLEMTAAHQPVIVPRQNTSPSQPSSPTLPGSSYSPPPYIAPPAPMPPQPNVIGVPPRRKTRSRGFLGCSPGCLVAITGVIIAFCGGFTLLALVITLTLGPRVEDSFQQQLSSVDDYRNFQSTFYYDRNGQLLYEAFGEGRRTNIALETVPQYLIDATLAIEDDNFYTNPGIDVPATTRAMLQYTGLLDGDTGGSTITQQLVRNVLFSPEYRAERSIQRKVEEIVLALLLTGRKSKDDILEMYLNEIYYGNLAYGIEAASHVFFDKSVQELTLGEAALLAGLPQAPAELDPLNPDPLVQEAVNSRWRMVLDRMVVEGKITGDQRNEALRQGLTYNVPDAPLNAPHFTVYAQDELESLMEELGYGPEQITSGGLKVYTTVDLRVNDMAQQAAENQVAGLAPNNVTNAAVVVLKPLTGEILAMIGSVDYNNEAIDGRVNVTTAFRQPGSTMKPFTYAAAMELGMTPGDVIWDTPTTIGIPGQPGYTPVNYDGRYHGPMTLRTALANSFNIPAVQTLRSRVGVDYLLAFMNRLGVQSLGQDASLYGLSLTLGGGEVSPLELSRAYAVFANGGVLVPTTSILCVLDGEDNILYQFENGCPRGTPNERTVNRGGYGTQVMDPRIAYIISDILADNPARSEMMGANSPLNTGSLPSSVKTGTTNDVKDNWTVGFTRNVVVGVWVGNSNGDPMVNSSGLTGAAPIWNNVITGIYNDQSLLNAFTNGGQLVADQPSPPLGISVRQMCDVRRLVEPALQCGSSTSEWFLDGPAGIPDASGNLQYPPVDAPTPAIPPPNGPFLQVADPGIYRVMVQPIPPEIGQQITFNMPPGQAAPPPPLYCQVPVELAQQAVGAREQLFIAPPPVPEDAIAAEQYARSNGLSYLPTIACDQTLVTLGGTSPIVITAVIQQPQPGQAVSPNTPIIGTVQFSPDQALFYKLEVTGGQFPEWVTFGTTHSENVINGQLEVIPGLPAGSYRMRLAVVGHDGNYVQSPYEVPFSVP